MHDFKLPFTKTKNLLKHFVLNGDGRRRILREMRSLRKQKIVKLLDETNTALTLAVKSSDFVSSLSPCGAKHFLEIKIGLTQVEVI